MAFKDILLLMDPHSGRAGEYAVASASNCAAHFAVRADFSDRAPMVA